MLRSLDRRSTREAGMGASARQRNRTTHLSSGGAGRRAVGPGHTRSARTRWQAVRMPGAASQLAESRWRPLAFVACLTALTAAGLLYANRELAGDLFWLLAAGRHVDVHGVTG